jgi:hypothetical protein
MNTLTIDQFFEVFDRFAASATSTSVFRWEGLQVYDVDYDDPSYAAWRQGTERPERSVRTDSWLARIASSTLGGKQWTRVRYVTEPLTDYTAWELVAHAEAQAVGERILITLAPLAAAPTDFWLFDGAPTDRCAILMHYNADGAPTAFEYTDDPDLFQALAGTAERLKASAMPLNAYLPRSRTQVTGAA